MWARTALGSPAGLFDMAEGRRSHPGVARRRQRKNFPNKGRASGASTFALKLPSLSGGATDRNTPLRDPVASALPSLSAGRLGHHSGCHSNEYARRDAMGSVATDRPRTGPASSLIAGDAPLAARIGAAAAPARDAGLRAFAIGSALRPSWLITVVRHPKRKLLVAAGSGADAALLAPAFSGAWVIVQSCRARSSRLRLMPYARASLPTYALGGVNAATAGRLFGARLAGIAAIEGLVPDHSLYKNARNPAFISMVGRPL